MMRERETRLRANQRIVIKDGEESYPGTISTISRTGMSIKTQNTFPTYKLIEIVVKIAKKMIPLQASVRWVTDQSEESGETWYEVGVALQNPPSEYLRHFE